MPRTPESKAMVRDIQSLAKALDEQGHAVIELARRVQVLEAVVKMITKGKMK